MKLSDTPEFKEFKYAFMECLEWSNESFDEYDCPFEPIDQDIIDAHLLSFYSRTHYYVPHEEGADYAQLGHDFCLTSQGHGAGFWDGDWPNYGELLTELAQKYPEEWGI